MNHLAGNLPATVRRPVFLIPAKQAVARHTGRKVDAVIQPVFQGDKIACRGTVRCQPGKVAKFARRQKRVQGSEQGLDGVNRQNPQARYHGLEGKFAGANDFLLLAGVKVPGRRHQDQR